jgi:sugar phosphate isomerase/epimerase
MIYGVLNWTFHLTYDYNWADTIERHLEYMLRLRDKYQLKQMGIDFGIGLEDNQIPSRDAGYIQKLADRLASEGFTPIIGCGSLQIHADRRMFEKSLTLIEECLPVAAALGAPVARFYPVFHGRMNHEARKRLFVEGANRIAQVARQHGIKVCSENYEVLRLEDWEEILPQIDPQYGILNDVGNWLIFGTDPMDALRRFSDRTVHVQLKDYQLEDGFWRSVTLGEGTINIPEVLKLLKSMPWEPKICTIEIDLDEGDEFESVDKSLAYVLSLDHQELLTRS